MAGKDGCVHKCSEKRIDKNSFRMSLRESSFSSENCDLLWDFYVARSFAASTGTSI
jgi:hypothetical protein